MSKLAAIIVVMFISLNLIAAQCAGPAASSPAQNQAATAPAAPTAPAPTAPAAPVVKVMEPNARVSIPNGAVYLQLMNEGQADDRLISAKTDVAEAVELHETTMENDVMKMAPIDAVVVPAGGSATLEPGGKHIMMMGLKKELATGDTFELTLYFEQSEPQTIEVKVADSMAMGHSQMDHSQMDSGQAAMDGTDDMAGNQPAGDEMTHGDDATMTADHDHAMMAEMAMQPQLFHVVTAAYLLDTAGFHAMDNRLDETGQIDAGDAGVVNRVNGLLAVVDWPADLAGPAGELQTTLTQFAEALANNDVETAKTLAAQTHEAQHHLSHAIADWAGNAEGGSGPEQIFQVATAAYLMDTAGFHAMDDRLDETGQIDAGDAGVVNRVNGLLAVVDWPADLAGPAGELQTTLTQFAEALANNDVETAKTLAAQTHEAQHHLSHAIADWLGNAGQPDMAVDEISQHFQVTVAAYLLDTAGFHAMDNRLDETGQIDAGDAGVVNRVNGLLAVVDWPADLAGPAGELQTTLTQFAEALANDDVETAKTLAAQTHEAQHGLSHTIAGWVAGAAGHAGEHQHDEAGQGN